MADTLPAHAGILDESEHQCLTRLSKLVARLFRVPVAYVALLGPDLKVSNRVGVCGRLLENLRTFPLEHVLAGPVLWPDPAGAPVPGFVPGDVRFAAGAPLRSVDGLELGLLAIADTKPRPDFTSEDLTTLGELAAVLAGKMELRILASQPHETPQPTADTEQRLRSIADCAPVMIICSGVEGVPWFVNKAWLEFTGRTLDDELGPFYADTFHPEYRDRVVETYWDAFQIRSPRTIRFPMLRHDGQYRLVEARGAPRFLGDGAFAGFVGCYIDLGPWEYPEAAPSGVFRPD